MPSSIDKIEDETAEIVRDLQGVDMSELTIGINEYFQNPWSRKRPLLPRRSGGLGKSWGPVGGPVGRPVGRPFVPWLSVFTMALEFIQDLASS
jgi:hypothetical protein